MARRKSADFLVEVGTEELPPKALKNLMTAFADNLASLLDEQRLGYEDIRAYASPRRLAVIAGELALGQDDQEVVQKGPPVSVAFDDGGAVTRAGQAFADKFGVSVEALEREKTEKGEWLVWRAIEKGLPAEGLLPGLVEQALERLPIPRRMRWGDYDDEFVRPVHWVVLLHGKHNIDAEILGVPADLYTYGHRFLAPGGIRVPEPSKYVSLLEKEGRVLADFESRRERVVSGVKKAAADAGGTPVGDDNLYDEVTALTEWPVPMAGSFDESFLKLPVEVIIATLTSHQRYFPVVDKNAGLLPAFVSVANIDSEDPDQVRYGNERVIRPRLADAAFFWETDKRTPLADRLPALDRVVYQKGLGTIADKSARVLELTKMIASQHGKDDAEAERAALLAKCDLVTGMVGEFPELQGVMGGYYALVDGETDDVATAIGEQYLPRFAGDALPGSRAGQMLAVADRLDTLAGIFALGQRPSGNRDPFGLRRSALGIFRIVVQKQLNIDLPALITASVDAQPVRQKDTGALAEELYDYIADRMRGWYLERRNLTADMFEAVRVRRPASLLDFDERLNAVSAFVRLDEAESLAAANKRISNILKDADLDPKVNVRPSLLREDAEKALVESLESARSDIAPLLRKRAYADALTRLAGLREPVDRFFDDVLVMCDNAALKRNRLALLSQLRSLFLDIADISRLTIGRE